MTEIDYDRLYDLMIDDYLTGDGSRIGFESKKTLAKKFGVNPANFTDQELKKIKTFLTTNKSTKCE